MAHGGGGGGGGGGGETRRIHLGFYVQFVKSSENQYMTYFNPYSRENLSITRTRFAVYRTKLLILL